MAPRPPVRADDHGVHIESLLDEVDAAKARLGDVERGHAATALEVRDLKEAVARMESKIDKLAEVMTGAKAVIGVLKFCIVIAALGATVVGVWHGIFAHAPHVE